MLLVYRFALIVMRNHSLGFLKHNRIFNLTMLLSQALNIMLPIRIDAAFASADVEFPPVFCKNFILDVTLLQICFNYHGEHIDLMIGKSKLESKIVR